METTTRGRAEPEPKPRAKGVFGRVRLSAAEAFGVVAHALGVTLGRRALYPKRIPNRETLDAIRETDAGINVTEYDSPEAFRNGMDRA